MNAIRAIATLIGTSTSYELIIYTAQKIGVSFFLYTKKVKIHEMNAFLWLCDCFRGIFII